MTTRDAGRGERPIRRPTRRRQVGGCWAGALVLLGVSVILSLGIAAAAIFELRYQDRIYPGVRMERIELAGLTRAQATELLTNLFENTNRWWPSLRYEDQAWEPERADLGISIDVEQTVDEAYRVGRQGGLVAAATEQWRAWRQEYVLQPIIQFDRATARRYLSSVAGQVRVPVREASLEVQGTQVLIQPSQVGFELDEVATLDRLEDRILTWQGGEVELVVAQLDPVIQDISGLGERVQRIISLPLELVGPADLPESQWTLSPTDLAEMLVLEQHMGEDGRVSGVAVLSDTELRARLTELVAKIDREPEEGRLDIDMLTMQPAVMQPSVTGYRLKIDEAIPLIQQHALSQERQVPLPIEQIAPQIDTSDLDALGLKELVIEATTNFAGSSADRMNNIAVATKRFDGVLLTPGEIFSFNKYLGDVTKEEGFSESLIIWGDRTAVGIGGGVCQVSTTAFRAAFWAGLEILERWAHGYRVAWYEPPVGLDSTVYSPSVDFKFRNDTPYYMLIKTATDLNAGTVTFYFFGTKTGRTVEMEGPIEENPVPHGAAEYQDDPSLPAGTVKQVDWPHDGLDVTIRRIVKDGDTILHQDEFFSRYQPWKAVFLRGTG